MSSPAARHPRSSPSPSPSRPPESQVEVLYNTAVQSFVRRDHVKTHSTLSRLLVLLKKDAPVHSDAWFEVSRPRDAPAINGDSSASTSLSSPSISNEEWRIKSLKLLISAYASLHSDPPSNPTTLPTELAALLPPSSPRVILDHVRDVCTTSYVSSTSAAALLPPQLISTLILAALKLRPTELALDFAHHLAEDWLAALPDHFILSISPTPPSRTNDPEVKKRVESAREGYCKVVELFVGEVLSREGEWEMARAFLDGEIVLGSKRKEALYRHLRALQTKAAQPAPTASPSSSLILPNEGDHSSSSSPSPKPFGSTARSQSRRSSSASSSSSEKTARPPASFALSGNGLTSASKSASIGDRKGKARVVVNGQQTDSHERHPMSTGDSDIPETNGALAHAPNQTLSSTSNGHAAKPSPDSKPPAKASSRRQTTPTALSRIAEMTLSHLPPYLSNRLSPILHSPLSQYLPIPIFVIPLILIFLSARRRLRNRNAMTTSTPLAGRLATMDTADIRTRLALARARARERGWVQWIWFYVRWWLSKFGGVWKLGTTITYV